MSLRTTLETDLKAAMKARDNETRDAIRYVLAAVKNAEIAKREDLTPEEEIRLLQTQVKQRQDSIEQFRAGGREDLAEKEVMQVGILEKYLPKQLDDAELAQLVKDGIAESGAQGPKDMGKVMGLLKSRTEGRVDGRRLSSAVRDALAG
jgi:uncharacterized protein